MVLSKKEIRVVRTSSQDKLSFLREHFCTLHTTQFLQEDLFNIILAKTNFYILWLYFWADSMSRCFFAKSIAGCFCHTNDQSNIFWVSSSELFPTTKFPIGPSPFNLKLREVLNLRLDRIRSWVTRRDWTKSCFLFYDTSLFWRRKIISEKQHIKLEIFSALVLTMIYSS